MSAPQYDVPSGTTTSYYLRNPHGDVVGLTQAGASANIAATTYDPWGTVVGAASSNGAGSTLGFQGQVTDRATGMTKTDTRFYDPSQGRFTAQDVLFGDPMDAGSLNQYAYANGNPVTLNDPTGMAAPQKCAVMGMTWCRNHYDEWRAAKIARMKAEGENPDNYNFALGCSDCVDQTQVHVYIKPTLVDLHDRYVVAIQEVMRDPASQEKKDAASDLGYLMGDLYGDPGNDNAIQTAKALIGHTSVVGEMAVEIDTRYAGPVAQVWGGCWILATEGMVIGATLTAPSGVFTGAGAAVGWVGGCILGGGTALVT